MVAYVAFVTITVHLCVYVLSTYCYVELSTIVSTVFENRADQDCVDHDSEALPSLWQHKGEQY